jgi:membrane-bound metal-dependent hydrolase YbcI (DUF457 family)
VRIVPGITATNPLDLYYMPYTHSLIAAVLWSLAALVVYRLFTNHRGPAALVVALAVFSHWLLDLVVHRPDLPLYDDTWKVGFGLWNYPLLALASEAALLAIGVALYLRTTTPARHVWITIGFALVMFGVHCFTFFGAPPSSPAMAATMALVAYVILAAGAFALERRSWVRKHPLTARKLSVNRR